MLLCGRSNKTHEVTIKVIT